MDTPRYAPSLSVALRTTGCHASNKIKARSLAINDYLAKMQSVDSDHNVTTNTTDMIAQIRKVYYHSNGWNNDLIRGTANISPFVTNDTSQAIAQGHEVPTNNQQETKIKIPTTLLNSLPS